MTFSHEPIQVLACTIICQLGTFKVNIIRLTMFYKLLETSQLNYIKRCVLESHY